MYALPAPPSSFNVLIFLETILGNLNLIKMVYKYLYQQQTPLPTLWHYDIQSLNLIEFDSIVTGQIQVGAGTIWMGFLTGLCVTGQCLLAALCCHTNDTIPDCLVSHFKKEDTFRGKIKCGSNCQWRLRKLKPTKNINHLSDYWRYSGLS